MILEPECFKRNCRHFLGVKSYGPGESDQRVTCRAFPDGIPEEIAYGKNKHTQPFEATVGFNMRRAGPDPALAIRRLSDE